MLELEKLVKLMMRTTSPNDFEALVSIRMANTMLRENNINWEDFISQKTVVINEVVQKIQKKDDAEIEEMLEMCLKHVKGPSITFIESLNEYYWDKNRLSPRQKESLKRFYDNL